MTGRNVSPKRLGPVFPIDEYINVLGVKPATAEKYQKVRVAYFDANCIMVSVGTDRGYKNTEQKTFLEPREGRSVSIAAGANWVGNDEWFLEDAIEVFFPEAGDFVLKYGWEPGSTSADEYHPFNKEAIIRIKVSAPTGQDKVVFDMLKKNRRLVAALLDPIFEPHPLAVADIKDIVQRYPSTIYAKYARFALARIFLKGTGQRIGWKQAMQEDVLQKYVLWLQGSKEEQFIQFVKMYFTPQTDSYERRQRIQETLGRGYQTNYLSAVQRADIERLLESRAKPKSEFAAHARRFVSEYCIVRPDHRAAAIAELEKLRNEKFAYQPSVLILLRKLYKDEQPEKAKEIEAILNRDFPDAIEWLEAVASSLTAEQWQTFRKTHIIPPPARVEDE